LFLFLLRKYLLFLGEPHIYNVCNKVYLVRGIKDNGAYIGAYLKAPDNNNKIVLIKLRYRTSTVSNNEV